MWGPNRRTAALTGVHESRDCKDCRRRRRCLSASWLRWEPCLWFSRCGIGSRQTWLALPVILAVAVLASGLKVQLPGIDGTMSVNFLFILLGRDGDEPG